MIDTLGAHTTTIIEKGDDSEATKQINRFVRTFQSNTVVGRD